MQFTIWILNLKEYIPFFSLPKNKPVWCFLFIYLFIFCKAIEVKKKPKKPWYTFCYLVEKNLL